MKTQLKAGQKFWCHLAFSKDRKLRFPILADFEPKGAVAKMYGVYDEKGGGAERALFVIDSCGVIRWSFVSPVGINPGADGILKALEGIAKKANSSLPNLNLQRKQDKP